MLFEEQVSDVPGVYVSQSVAKSKSKARNPDPMQSKAMCKSIERKPEEAGCYAEQSKRKTNAIAGTSDPTRDSNEKNRAVGTQDEPSIHLKKSATIILNVLATRQIFEQRN